MRRLCKIVILISTLVTGPTVAATAVPAQRDYSIVLGKTQKFIIMSGSYARALDLAMIEWKKQHAIAALKYYKITISAQPRTDLLYVRFLPRRENPGTVGCATAYGTEILFVINVDQDSIVKRSLPC